jgi:hypothetical protein
MNNPIFVQADVFCMSSSALVSELVPELLAKARQLALGVGYTRSINSQCPAS